MAWSTRLPAAASLRLLVTCEGERASEPGSHGRDPTGRCKRFASGILFFVCADRLAVDARLRIPEASAAAAGADGEDLGEDRDGGLGGRVGADVEPARARDAVELVLGHTGLDEQTAAPLLVAPRAEPPDVERVGREGALHEREVELVVVSQHDHGGGRV